MMKVLTVGPDGEQVGEWSHQLPVDPFKYSHTGIQEPPFPLEQLIFLAEQHPVHSAALEQKSLDVVGQGWEWVSEQDEKKQDDSEREKLDDWFKELSNDNETDQTTHEILLSAWLDLETTGQGLIELARDPAGKLRYWFSSPSHTFRFHKDGIRVAQMRQGKRRWFKRWIPNDERAVDMVSGEIGETRRKVENPANEIFVLRRPSRRSSYYGIPTYVPATGWIMLSTAARDDNIFFFSNRREPRWAIVLENIEDDPELENQLRRALQVDLAKPHQNLLLPLTGPAKVHFQQLGDNKGDMSWEKLQERADAAILVAHRMPGERIGLIRQGVLGGSTVSESGRAYKESFVQTSQALLSSRVNKLIQHESGVDKPTWTWAAKELDLSEQNVVQENSARGFQAGIFRLNEAREKAGEEPLPEDDERGDKFVFELNPSAHAAAAAASTRTGEGGANMATGDRGGLQESERALAEQVQRLIDQGGQPAPDETAG